jgi:predicted anti-sigma-YlaC factor YlaD
MTPTTPECDQARPELGVYVVGAIAPGDRALVDAHLATCSSCRDELAGLAGLPALLDQLDQDDVDRICPDNLARELASWGPPNDLAVARRRRNRSRYLQVAAAVVVLAVGLLVGRTFLAPATGTVAVPVWPANTVWRTAAATSAATGASATVAFAHEPWGTAVQVLVHNIPIGTTCHLWIIHPDGTRTMAAGWTTASDEGQHSYPGSMASAAGPISQFQITAGTTTLVTVTPA